MDNTKIEWADHTFNPWSGCTKVSDGCKHCYAETTSKRKLMTVPGTWGPRGSRVIAPDRAWNAPIGWNDDALDVCERRRVFCASVADAFEGRDTMPPEAWQPVCEARERLFALIGNTPQLDWLLLTKRPENIQPMWQGGHRKNVWLGTSVEDHRVVERIDRLRESRELAQVLFLSIEPLIGPIAEDLALDGIDWVIVGGESGTQAREMKEEWVLPIRDICFERGIPFFFKQWWGRDVKGQGRLLDGREWNEFPS